MKEEKNGGVPLDCQSQSLAPLSPLRESVLKLYMLQFTTVYNYTFSRQLWQPALDMSTYRNLSQNSLRISGDKKRRHTFGFWLVCFLPKHHGY